jgi:hypothetical protein
MLQGKHLSAADEYKVAILAMFSVFTCNGCWVARQISALLTDKVHFISYHIISYHIIPPSKIQLRFFVVFEHMKGPCFQWIPNGHEPKQAVELSTQLIYWPLEGQEISEGFMECNDSINTPVLYY